MTLGCGVARPPRRSAETEGHVHAAGAAPSQADLWQVRLLFLVIFSSYGTTSAYVTLYFRRVGLEAAQIGVLIAVQPLVMLVAGPLWSLIADRLGLRRRLLTLVTGLSVLPMVAMAGTAHYVPLLGLSALQAFFQGPIQPLMDSTALGVLGNDRHLYANVRAYGSLGYAPVAWVMGWVIQWADIRWIFAGYALLMGAGCLLSLSTRAETPALRPRIGRGLGHLLRDREWRLFAVAVFIALIAQGVTYGYIALYLDTLGAPESLIGFSGTLGSLGQTTLMLGVLPRLLRRWGSHRLMVLALLTFALRCAIWALPRAGALGRGRKPAPAGAGLWRDSGGHGGLCRPARARGHAHHVPGAHEQSRLGPGAVSGQWHRRDAL